MPDSTALPVIDHAVSDALIAELTEHYAQHQTYPTDPALLRQMVEQMGDSRGTVRLRFATMLGEYIKQPAIAPLVEALAAHKNVVVRRAAAKTLTLIGDRSTIPSLLHALFHDEDTVVKGSSVGGLARMGEAAVPPLLEILADPAHSESMKGHAAWALAFIGAAAKEYLTPALNSDSPEVRAAVVGAIAKVALDEDPLDPDGATETAIAPAAAKTALIALLVSALDDSDSDVRCEAAVALSNLGHTAAIPRFLQLLSHPDLETRKAAALALMKLGDRSVLAPLQTALEQEAEAPVQAVIKLAMGQILRRVGE